MPQNVPQPVAPIVIRVVLRSEDSGGIVRLHIWTATRAAHLWISEQAPKFGEYQEAEKRYHGSCNQYGDDYHVLRVTPLYDMDEVVKYLSEIQAE